MNSLPDSVLLRVPMAAILDALRAEGLSVVRVGEGHGWESLSALAARCGLR